ncbi:MAG: homoserine dehydrogenase, partial [candidate division NC10 bacterium]|nr:homoserine dehydrogenase [candidate division NC10 bacterium]
APLIERRVGSRLCIRKIADLDIITPRSVELDPATLTTKAEEVVQDPSIDIVVELIGGTEAAKDLCLQALSRGKHLVTANKALLALHGRDIYRAAIENRVDLGFEASVCGGIPLIKALREGLVANRILAIMGIINGTCNYILSKMSEQGRDFKEVLAEAQARGYAEADPSLDIDGIDAAQKLQILASIAYGSCIDFHQIFIEGIRGIDPLDIKFASELGYKMKLLAIAKGGNGEMEVRVHPTLIPDEHLLASVRGVYNAVYLLGDSVGSQMFYGRGAGQMPTASAVVSDIVEIAHNILFERPSRVSLLTPSLVEGAEIRVKDISKIRSQYYLRVSAIDKPGVLSKISGVLGSHNISIASVIQKVRHEQATVPVVMMTHEAVEGDMQKALKEIDYLEVVTEKTVCVRVEGEVS